MCFPLYFGAPPCVNQGVSQQPQQLETPWDTASRITLTALRAISVVGTVFAFSATLATQSIVALGTTAALAVASLGLFAIGDENPADALCWALRLLGESAHHFSRIQNQNHGHYHLGGQVYVPPLPQNIPPSGGRVYQPIPHYPAPAALPAPYPYAGATYRTGDLAERASVGRREDGRENAIPQRHTTIPEIRPHTPTIYNLLNDIPSNSTPMPAAVPAPYVRSNIGSILSPIDLAEREAVGRRTSTPWLDTALYSSERGSAHNQPDDRALVEIRPLPGFATLDAATERAPVGRRDESQERQSRQDLHERAPVGRRTQE